jgi:diaminobutyrate-2-oxoglutarate transaminase
MKTINRMESEVRTYCRSFPAVFDRASGATLRARDGREYIDFFAGAGALNYGHNHPVLRDALIDYVAGGGIVHSLDMATEAKVRFLDALDRRILRPRDLRYKAMFPGPTGTNAVEAALKLARKVTGRTQIVSFTNAFHGMTLGALAATGSARKRSGAGVPLGHVIRAPFAGYYGPQVDTLDNLRMLLDDASSGVDAPAAFLVETIQAEGGVNIASTTWLQGLAALARDHGALLIIDDIQVGCGRAGSFFSFEDAGIYPDIVCLSKSLSAFGLPFSMMLMRPEHDVFSPGEHNGTFRGNNLAFVTATAAFEHFWTDDRFCAEIEEKSAIAYARLKRIAGSEGAEVRGKGLIFGLHLEHAALAKLASARAFGLGLVIETAGAEDQVLKILPPLTIEIDHLVRGLDIVAESVALARREAARGARHVTASCAIETEAAS